MDDILSGVDGLPSFEDFYSLVTPTIALSSDNVEKIEHLNNAVPCVIDYESIMIKNLVTVSKSLYGLDCKPEDITINSVHSYPVATTKPLNIKYSINGLNKSVFVKRYDNNRLMGLGLANFYEEDIQNVAYNQSVIIEDEVFGMTLDTLSEEEINTLFTDESFLETMIRQDVQNRFMFLGDAHRGNFILTKKVNPQTEEVTYTSRCIDFDRLFSISSLSDTKFKKVTSEGSLRISVDDELYDAIASIDEGTRYRIEEDEKERIRRTIVSMEDSYNSFCDVASLYFKNNDLSERHSTLIDSMSPEYHSCDNIVDVLSKYTKDNIF